MSVPLNIACVQFKVFEKFTGAYEINKLMADKFDSIDYMKCVPSKFVLQLNSYSGMQFFSVYQYT